MRDISVSTIDKNGLATFSLLNIKPVTGINLLVSIVTKKILSSSFKTLFFEYYGLDLKEIPYIGISNKSVDNIKTILSSKLKNIESSIKDNTSSYALETEKLSSLLLDDVIYDSNLHKIYIKVKIISMVSDSQSLLFPLDE